MADPKLYPPQNPMELEPHFCRHMQAMTAEGLDSKAAIAEQLAWRDKQLAGLRFALRNELYSMRALAISFGASSTEKACDEKLAALDASEEPFSV